MRGLRTPVCLLAAVAAMSAAACTAGRSVSPTSTANRPAASVALTHPADPYEAYCANAYSCPHGHVLASLRRPLHLPHPRSGEACPVGCAHSVSPDFGPALGPGPVYPVGLGSKGVLSFVYPPDPKSVYAGSAWGGQKVLWVGRATYRGPVLIRGARLDGSGRIGFGLDIVPWDDLEFPPISELSPPQWRNWPSTTRLRAPGCYGYQVDGLDFSLVIVFRAVLAR